jgi:hypothetical protein
LKVLIPKQKEVLVTGGKGNTVLTVNGVHFWARTQGARLVEGLCSGQITGLISSPDIGLLPERITFSLKS